MAYNIFRKNLLFKYDFLIDYSGHKSRKYDSVRAAKIPPSFSSVQKFLACICRVEIKTLFFHISRSAERGAGGRRGKSKTVYGNKAKATQVEGRA